jgi:hypothetical protein
MNGKNSGGLEAEEGKAPGKLKKVKTEFYDGLYQRRLNPKR